MRHANARTVSQTHHSDSRAAVVGPLNPPIPPRWVRSFARSMRDALRCSPRRWPIRHAFPRRLSPTPSPRSIATSALSSRQPPAIHCGSGTSSRISRRLWNRAIGTWRSTWDASTLTPSGLTAPTGSPAFCRPHPQLASWATRCQFTFLPALSRALRSRIRGRFPRTGIRADTVPGLRASRARRGWARRSSSAARPASLARTRVTRATSKRRRAKRSRTLPALISATQGRPPQRLNPLGQLLDLRVHILATRRCVHRARGPRRNDACGRGRRVRHSALVSKRIARRDRGAGSIVIHGGVQPLCVHATLGDVPPHRLCCDHRRARLTMPGSPAARR